jgi:hypothetical protein
MRIVLHGAMIVPTASLPSSRRMRRSVVVRGCRLGIGRVMQHVMVTMGRIRAETLRG